MKPNAATTPTTPNQSLRMTAPFLVGGSRRVSCQPLPGLPFSSPIVLPVLAVPPRPVKSTDHRRASGAGFLREINLRSTRRDRIGASGNQPRRRRSVRVHSRRACVFSTKRIPHHTPTIASSDSGQGGYWALRPSRCRHRRAGSTVSCHTSQPSLSRIVAEPPAIPGLVDKGRYVAAPWSPTPAVTGWRAPSGRHESLDSMRRSETFDRASIAREWRERGRPATSAGAGIAP